MGGWNGRGLWALMGPVLISLQVLEGLEGEQAGSSCRAHVLHLPSCCACASRTSAPLVARLSSMYCCPAAAWFLVQVLNDLLDPARTNLKLREDARRGVVSGVNVEGIREETLVSAEHALQVIAQGNEQRKVRRRWQCVGRAGVVGWVMCGWVGDVGNAE